MDAATASTSVRDLRSTGHASVYEQALLDRMLEDEERKWMDNVHIRRLMTLGQRKGAGRVSTSWEKKYNQQVTSDRNR